MCATKPRGEWGRGRTFSSRLRSASSPRKTLLLSTEAMDSGKGKAVRHDVYGAGAIPDLHISRPVP